MERMPRSTVPLVVYRNSRTDPREAEYDTKCLVLEHYNAMAKAIVAGKPYEGELDRPDTRRPAPHTQASRGNHGHV